jgi:hypothetical protein
MKKGELERYDATIERREEVGRQRTGHAFVLIARMRSYFRYQAASLPH